MKTTTLLVLLAGIFLFSSCNDPDSGQIYTPTAKEATLTQYKLGIHPYLNSKNMYIVYRPIITYIEAKLGDVKIILETSGSYEKYEKKLYGGDFDLALPNPLQTYRALPCGYEVIAKMKPDSVFKGIFIARKDAHITQPSQIKGHKVSFPARTALAGTMMPLLFLHEHGLNVKHDINQKYVTSHYSSILNVFSSYTIVGATWPPPWELWKKENPIKAEELEVVWETKPLINNGFIVKKSMDISLKKRITEVLTDLDTVPAGKHLLENAGFEGFARASDKDYVVVSDFLKTYDKAIGSEK